VASQLLLWLRFRLQKAKMESMHIEIMQHNVYIIIIESLLIKTSSDITLHLQLNEMAEGCMLIGILVGGECLLAVESIQSLELGACSLTVCFVFGLGC
jgi:hypothetical protein